MDRPSPNPRLWTEEYLFNPRKCAWRNAAEKLLSNATADYKPNFVRELMERALRAQVSEESHGSPSNPNGAYGWFDLFLANEIEKIDMLGSSVLEHVNRAIDIRMHEIENQRRIAEARRREEDQLRHQQEVNRQRFLGEFERELPPWRGGFGPPPNGRSGKRFLLPHQLVHQPGTGVRGIIDKYGTFVPLSDFMVSFLRNSGIDLMNC